MGRGSFSSHQSKDSLFLNVEVFKISIQLNFIFQKLSGKGLHAKVVCDSSESMAELRREIYFTHDTTT